MNLTSFRDLLVEELRDIYDGEQQLVHALPLMAETAVLPELKQAFVIATMLQETLDEEGKTNKLLNRIAMHSVNPEAAEATRPGKALREAVGSVLETSD